MKLFYALLFVLSVILSAYNWFYTKEVRGARKRVGFGVPRHIDRFLHLNIFISLTATLIIGILLLVSLW
jgi:hypothetical protein